MRTPRRADDSRPASWHRLSVAPTYREVQAKTIARAGKIVDPWFLARLGMNLYRGCEHGCRYCDGRAEKYRVEGVFDRDIAIKVNAPMVLARELSRLREPGFVLVGGGVSDAYQPAEQHHGLARQALLLVLRHKLPVHVLTKSELVERDFDVLQSMTPVLAPSSPAVFKRWTTVYERTSSLARARSMRVLARLPKRSAAACPRGSWPCRCFRAFRTGPAISNPS